MKNMNSFVAVSGLVLAVGVMVASTEANAATTPRQFPSNPTGYCQGALPAFETNIRKRPLAVQNEGTSNAFVTCSFTSQGAFGTNANNPTSVEVFFSAVNDTELTINCTGVSGFQGGTNQFITKSAIAPATGVPVSVTWNAADFTGAPATFPSGAFGISCELPPGAAINNSSVQFAEEIGT